MNKSTEKTQALYSAAVAAAVAAAGNPSEAALKKVVRVLVTLSED